MFRDNDFQKCQKGINWFHAMTQLLNPLSTVLDINSNNIIKRDVLNGGFLSNDRFSLIPFTVPSTRACRIPF